MEKSSSFELSAPLSLALITTNRCNLRCKHCINSSSQKCSDELTTEQIIDYIDQSKKYGIAYIDFNGGEFFTRNDTDCILDYAIKQGIKIIITTNGTLITDSWIEKYAGKIHLIRISLDDYDEYKHDSFRGVKGAFSKTIDTIIKLKGVGYRITILSTITKSRIETFKKFVCFIKELGVDSLHTTLLFPAGRGTNLSDETINAEDHRKFLEIFLEVSSDLNKEGEFMLLDESSQRCLLDSEKPIFDGVKCGAAFTEIAVSNYGFALPCAAFMGCEDVLRIEELDTRKYSLNEIYHNATIMKQIRTISSLGGRCKDCNYLKHCGGGCRAAAFIASGDIFGEDPVCWYGT